MQLVHYSDRPLTEIHSVEQHGEIALKPRGIWLSDDDCEDNWRTWCIGERFRLETLAIRHEIILRPDANVLIVPSAYELDAFTSEYGSPHSVVSTFYIDWKRVAERYQGIVITPYQWSRRMADHTFWYYGWDCASGCIWDVNAVEMIVPLPAIPIECEAAE